MQQRRQNYDPVDGGGFDFGAGFDLATRTSASPFVLFQRGGPQVLAMYQGPPATSAWNRNELAEHFIYEGEVHPATAQQQTMEDEAKKEDEKNLVHVDTVAEETEEEESVRIPAWQNPNTKRCARQAVALLNQVVLDAMPTDNLTWIMQAGFQSLMLRCVRHWVSLSHD